MSPRFQGSNLDANLALVDSLRAIAAEVGASPAQVAIAWVAAQGNDIVPLVGARRRDRLSEALGALDVKLTDAHLAALANAFPPGAAAGGRYPEAQLAHMDSEKRAKASWAQGAYPSRRLTLANPLPSTTTGVAVERASRGRSSSPRSANRRRASR